jgi:hypothetical protein
MGITGQVVLKVSRELLPDRRATVIFDTWGGRRGRFSVVSLPFATSPALFRGFFRRFGLIVVAADEGCADARRLNVILWKDPMEPNRCRGWSARGFLLRIQAAKPTA